MKRRNQRQSGPSAMSLSTLSSRPKDSGLNGLTLIELVIYIGIFATAAGFLIGIFSTSLRVQNRESAVAEVTQQTDFVLQNIQRYVQESSLIDIPAGVATSTLKLRPKATSTDPILIFASGTAGIYLKQGTGAPTALTGNKVNLGNFTVTKFENPGGHATVQIDLTINYNTSTAPRFSDTSRTLKTAISRVTAATFDSDLLPNGNNIFSLGQTANAWKNAYFLSNVSVGTTSLPTLFTVATTSNIFNVLSGGLIGIGTISPDSLLELSAPAAAISLNENSATPATPASGAEARIYMKADKFIIQYNEAGTVRYKYLDLTGTTTTWTHTTVAP